MLGCTRYARQRPASPAIGRAQTRSRADGTLRPLRSPVRALAADWRVSGAWHVIERSCIVQNTIASPGKGILAMDESNGTCGKRLDSIGVENTEDNRKSYRELLVTTPGLGDYISGAILFEETLYQSCSTGKTMVEELNGQGLVAGIKVRTRYAYSRCLRARVARRRCVLPFAGP